jgi:hypothetical protein
MRIVEMPELDRETFEAEAKRLLEAARREKVVLRILGSLAFQMHCPRFGHLQARMGRHYTDIDFAGYGHDVKRIRALFSGAGYSEDTGIYVESEGSRLIFNHPVTGMHVDVFLDKLEFCHSIAWNGRLEVDEPTIPLAEMVLEKMQIVEINEKDVIDTIMLLLEHPLGASDEEIINIDHIAQLCSGDWGLWRTTTMNLDKVRQLAASYPQLSDEEKGAVGEQVAGVLHRIEREPKSLRWRLRAKVGDRKKWYRDVGEFGQA